MASSRGPAQPEGDAVHRIVIAEWFLRLILLPSQKRWKASGTAKNKNWITSARWGKIEGGIWILTMVTVCSQNWSALTKQIGCVAGNGTSDIMRCHAAILQHGRTAAMI